MFDSSDLTYPIINEYIIDNLVYYSIETEKISTLIKIPQGSNRIIIIDFLARLYYRNSDINNYYTLYELLKSKFSDITDKEIEFYKLKYS